MILDQDIGMFSNQMNNKILSYINSKLEKYNITTEQYRVLLNVYKEDNIKQKKLSEKVHKDQPTLARILDILERKKMVERCLSTQDRRAFFIHITEHGKEMVKELVPYLEDVFGGIVQGIPIENLVIYREVLMKMEENIELQKLGGHNE